MQLLDTIRSKIWHISATKFISHRNNKSTSDSQWHIITMPLIDNKVLTTQQIPATLQWWCSPSGNDVSRLSFMFSLDKYRACEKIPYGILLITFCSMLIDCHMQTHNCSVTSDLHCSELGIKFYSPLAGQRCSTTEDASHCLAIYKKQLKHHGSCSISFQIRKMMQWSFCTLTRLQKCELYFPLHC